MPSKQELEGLPLTGLAVLCKKVADGARTPRLESRIEYCIQFEELTNGGETFLSRRE